MIGRQYEIITLDSDSDDEAKQPQIAEGPVYSQHVNSVKRDPCPAPVVPPPNVVRGMQVGHVRPQVREQAANPAPTPASKPMAPIRPAINFPIVFSQQGQSFEVLCTGKNSVTLTVTHGSEHQSSFSSDPAASAHTNPPATNTRPPSAAMVAMALPRQPLVPRTGHNPAASRPPAVAGRQSDATAIGPHPAATSVTQSVASRPIATYLAHPQKAIGAPSATRSLILPLPPAGTVRTQGDNRPAVVQKVQLPTSIRPPVANTGRLQSVFVPPRAAYIPCATKPPAAATGGFATVRASAGCPTIVVRPPAAIRPFAAVPGKVQDVCRPPVTGRQNIHAIVRPPFADLSQGQAVIRPRVASPAQIQGVVGSRPAGLISAPATIIGHKQAAVEFSSAVPGRPRLQSGSCSQHPFSKPSTMAGSSGSGSQPLLTKLSTTAGSSRSGDSEWSSKSLESVRALEAMMAHPDKIPKFERPSPAKTNPSPNKALQMFKNFRHRYRSDLETTPEVPLRPVIEMVDLTDDLPDLEDQDVSLTSSTSSVKQEAPHEAPSVMELLFRQVGSTMGNRLKTMTTPPRGLSTPPTTPSGGSAVKRKFQEEDDGKAKARRSLLSSPGPSRSCSFSPPTLITDSPCKSLHDFVVSVDSDSSFVSEVEVATTVDHSAKEPFTGKCESLADVCPLSPAPAIVDIPRRVPQLSRQSSAKPVATPPDEIRALSHTSVSPNAGLHAKASQNLISGHLRQSLVGPILAPAAGGKVFLRDQHDLVQIYFQADNTHAVTGLQMLTKLIGDGSRPQSWVVTRILEFIQRPEVATAKRSEVYFCQDYGPRLVNLARFFKQLNVAGNLLFYDLPLWDLLQWALADVDRGVVRDSQWEVLKLVLMYLEADVSRLGQPGAPAVLKSATSIHFSPDALFVRLRCIQDWIVAGLLSGVELEVLSALSRILALSLCVCKDCDSSALRLAEGFCNCYRRLKELNLRRRLLSLVRPGIVRTLFLALLLDRFGDMSTVPPEAVRVFAGCKLCFRKVVKFYFFMDALYTDHPSAIQDDHAGPSSESDDTKARGREEFLFVLVTLLESYVAILLGWLRTGPGLSETGSESYLRRELGRLCKIGNYVTGLEDRLFLWPAINRPHVQNAAERINDLSMLIEV